MPTPRPTSDRATADQSGHVTAVPGEGDAPATVATACTRAWPRAAHHVPGPPRQHRPATSSSPWSATAPHRQTSQIGRAQPRTQRGREGKNSDCFVCSGQRPSFGSGRSRQRRRLWVSLLLGGVVVEQHMSERRFRIWFSGVGSGCSGDEAGGSPGARPRGRRVGFPSVHWRGASEDGCWVSDPVAQVIEQATSLVHGLGVGVDVRVAASVLVVGFWL